jgi:hypothetical protein
MDGDDPPIAEPWSCRAVSLTIFTVVAFGLLGAAVAWLGTSKTPVCGHAKSVGALTVP